VDPAVSDRATGSAIRGRLHVPVCAFVIVFGATKVAELLDWSRLHRDVVAMLDRGSGTVTGLLLAGKGAELLLTVLAVLALTRRQTVLLRVALAGWAADLALLSIVAAVYGDLGRLIEHGLCLLAFAGLLAATFAYGRVPERHAVAQPEPGPEPVAAPRNVRVVEPHTTRTDLPVRGPDVTRQDLPVRGPDVTRQDLPVRSPDTTRLDLPVRKRPTAPPEPDDDV
jgi:hypothetical protein